MNNDELVTRRAQAIAEDRCFSKGRLRDEFRMKLLCLFYLHLGPCFSSEYHYSLTAVYQ